MTYLSFNLTEVDFQEIGPPDMPWAHLRAQVEMAGASFHVEAVAVRTHGRQQIAEWAIARRKFRLLRHGWEVDSFETVSLKDREYVLFVSPFSK